MNDSQDRLEWFKNTFRQYAEDLSDATNWKYLQNVAIYRKHTGDLDGAIEAAVKAISLMRTIPNLAEETATLLNYLAADLYLAKEATEQAEEAIRQSIALSRPRFPYILDDNLLILAEIQSRKGCYLEALASAEEALHLYRQRNHSHGVQRAEELIKRIKISLE